MCIAIGVLGRFAAFDECSPVHGQRIARRYGRFQKSVSPKHIHAWWERLAERMDGDAVFAPDAARHSAAGVTCIADACLSASPLTCRRHAAVEETLSFAVLANSIRTTSGH